ncbi:MAG TPA: hypothetical protein VK053_19700 [Jiangellaceae bacterium]|nr:hypothetical protein [Jiangellaceae bacterium]
MPSLDHLRDEETAKGVFGTGNALAEIANLLPSIEAEPGWHQRLVALLQQFLASHALSTDSMGPPSRLGIARPPALHTDLRGASRLWLPTAAHAPAK